MYVVTLHLTFFLEKNPLIPNTWRIFKVTYFMNSPLKGRKKSYRKPLQANSTYNLHRKLDCQNSNLPHHRHTPRYSLSHHKSHLVSTHFRGNLKIYFKKGIAGLKPLLGSANTISVSGQGVWGGQVSGVSRLGYVRFGLGLDQGQVQVWLAFQSKLTCGPVWSFVVKYVTNTRPAPFSITFNLTLGGVNQRIK